jgi:ABC-2 type transport system permease protein
MVYWRIVRSSYRRNLQYRLSHLVNNLASAIFGLVYIAIWAGVLAGKEASSPYDIRTMAAYISLCQCVLWVSVFLSPGLGIQTGVRSGAVSLDLIRPVNYMLYVLSHELGRIAYNACFRSVPIGLVLGIAVGFRLPAHPAVWLWTALSLCLAVYLGLLLFYLVGITSFLDDGNPLGSLHSHVACARHRRTDDPRRSAAGRAGGDRPVSAVRRGATGCSRRNCTSLNGMCCRANWISC